THPWDRQWDRPEACTLRTSSKARRRAHPAQCTSRVPGAPGRYSGSPCRGTCQKTSWGYSNHSYRNLWSIGDQTIAAQLKALLVLAALDIVGDTVDVVQPVVREARTAYANHQTIHQRSPVANDIERTGDRDRVRRAEGHAEYLLNRLWRLLLRAVIREFNLGRRRETNAHRRAQNADVGYWNRNGNLERSRVLDRVDHNLLRKAIQAERHRFDIRVSVHIDAQRRLRHRDAHVRSEVREALAWQ